MGARPVSILPDVDGHEFLFTNKHLGRLLPLDPNHLTIPGSFIAASRTSIGLGGRLHFYLDKTRAFNIIRAPKSFCV